MPSYQSYKDWNGFKVETRDNNPWRRGVFRVRNYYILDTPVIQVDVTPNSGKTRLTELQFQETARQGTDIWHVPDERIIVEDTADGGTRYTIRGRQVKEQEEYRIDILHPITSWKTTYDSAVVFIATIQSHDNRRRDFGLLLWGFALTIIGEALLALALGLISIQPVLELIVR